MNPNATEVGPFNQAVTLPVLLFPTSGTVEVELGTSCDGFVSIRTVVVVADILDHVLGGEGFASVKIAEEFSGQVADESLVKHDWLVGLVDWVGGCPPSL